MDGIACGVEALLHPRTIHRDMLRGVAQGDRTDPEHVDLSEAPSSTADSIEAVLQRAIAAPPAYPALEPGTVVAQHYVIERVLGAGGMGTVYLARDTRLDRDVALKLHRSAAADHRLHREAIAMAKLAHPNVVTVFEVGELDGRPFVAMEYVRGTTLRAWLGARERPPREALGVLLAAGEGLAAAHDAGLVHRDVKPDNIFVGEDGRVRIGDFGLAQLSRGAAAAVHTRSETREVAGLIVGTPAYMAPEQIEGRELDARTDQFAFCVAAWEALAGERPFAGSTTEELRDAIARGELRPGKRRVPVRLRRVLARGMAPDPRERWPSLRVVLAKLRAAERRPRVIAAAAAGTAAAAAAIAWLAWPAAAPGASCTDAGGEIDQILPTSIVDAAAGVVRGAGRANTSDEVGRITRAADQQRRHYRALSAQICDREARGQWTAELAAAGRECLAYDAQTSRELFVAAPGATSQTSNVVLVVTELPPLARCADPKLLAGWRWLASDPAQLERIVTARARLDAAGILAELGQLASARATHAAIAASPIRAEPAVALRLDFLRGAIALGENQVADAEPLLSDVYLRSRAQDDARLTISAARALIDLTGRARRDVAAARRWIRDGLAEAERLRVVAPRAVFDLQTEAASVLNSIGDSADALALVERTEPLAGDDDDVRRAWLGRVRANIYTSLGRVGDALASMAAAIDTARTVLGPRHPRVAELYARHAAILIEADKEQEALAAATEAMKILDGAGAEKTSVVANAELNLGAALLKVGHPAAAVHLERARRILVDSFGEAHPDIALVDTNLALIHNDRGEHGKAIAMLRNATKIQREMLGADHEELADGLYNLAVAERAAGKLDDALASSTRCLEILAKRQPGSIRHGAALIHVALVQNLRKHPAEALAAATAAIELPSAEPAESQIGAWARLEAARAVLGLRRDPARARELLGQARARYAGLKMKERVAEIDGEIARLR